MTKKETIQTLQSIEDRAVDFPYMTACDWVAIAAAKRHLENSLETKEVDLENLFQALPEKIVSEKSHQVYRLSIYYCDGQCVVYYVGEIYHDSLYAFSGNTLYEAIKGAWNWLCKNSTGG